MKKTSNLIFAGLILISHAFANSETNKESVDQINIYEEMLENGLRIITVPLKTNGAIAVGVGYHVGSVDDPRDVVGISHFLEHMMFKGTKNISGDKLKEAIAKYNKTKNAFTDYDVTFYYYICNKAFLDIDLKIEADRMQNLLLKDKDIEKEKEVIIEERKMRMDSDPRIKYMNEYAFKFMFGYSKYSYPVIGYLDQIKNCDRESLKKHYQKFYKPNNAFVLIVGDIKNKEALSKVKKYFGSIKKGEKIQRDRIIDPENTGLTCSMDHTSPQMTLHNLNLKYKIDRNLIDSAKKYAIVEIATNILANGFSSILYKNIVDKKELAYNLESQLDIRAYDSGKFSISTVFRENTTDSIVEKEITNIINDYVEKYLTEELFEKEKQKQLDQIDLMKDNPQTMCLFIIGNLIQNRKIDEIRKTKEIISSIQFDDIKKVAKKIFTKDNRIIKIYSHPKEKE